MVGAPKTLYQLAKLDADVRLSCRSCRAVVVLDRETLIAQRMAGGRSLDWAIFCQEARCANPDCTSADVRVELVPFPLRRLGAQPAARSRVRWRCSARRATRRGPRQCRDGRWRWRCGCCARMCRRIG